MHAGPHLGRMRRPDVTRLGRPRSSWRAGSCVDQRHARLRSSARRPPGFDGQALPDGDAHLAPRAGTRGRCTAGRSGSPPRRRPSSPCSPSPWCPETVAVVADHRPRHSSARRGRIRRLGMPLWWLAFPPFIDGLYNGNPQVLLAPAPRRRRSPPSPRWSRSTPARSRCSAASGRRCSSGRDRPAGHRSRSCRGRPTSPSSRRSVRRLSEQSDGGMSALAIPVLIPVAVIALVRHGSPTAPRGGSVPVLWPSTQWYYTSLAMPATTLLAGIRGRRAGPVRGALGRIVAAEVVWRLAGRRRRRRADAPVRRSPLTATHDRSQPSDASGAIVRERDLPYPRPGACLSRPGLVDPAAIGSAPSVLRAERTLDRRDPGGDLGRAAGRGPVGDAVLRPGPSTAPGGTRTAANAHDETLVVVRRRCAGRRHRRHRSRSCR